MSLCQQPHHVVEEPAETLVGGGGGEIIYLWLHCHHQNDFCIKVDSDESHFNVS